MNKRLVVLACALILAGLGAGAAVAEPTVAESTEQSHTSAPAPEAVAVLEAAIFSPAGGCSQEVFADLVPKPLPMGDCPGGPGGSCDNNQDCKGYFCPTGNIRCCHGGTGSGCEGTCGCCR